MPTEVDERESNFKVEEGTGVTRKKWKWLAREEPSIRTEDKTVGKKQDGKRKSVDREEEGKNKKVRSDVTQNSDLGRGISTKVGNQPQMLERSWVGESTDVSSTLTRG